MNGPMDQERGKKVGTDFFCVTLIHFEYLLLQLSDGSVYHFKPWPSLGMHCQ